MYQAPTMLHGTPAMFFSVPTKWGRRPEKSSPQLIIGGLHLEYPEKCCFNTDFKNMPISCFIFCMILSSLNVLMKIFLYKFEEQG